jgi:predicted permease
MLDSVRLSLRRLARQRLFALVVIATLALGIGANTAVFSVVESALLRPLPFPAADRLVVLFERSTAGMNNRLASPSSWAAWKTRARSFEDLAAFMWWDDTAFRAGDGPAETILTANATPEYFRILGLPPMLGRTLADTEDANVREVVISHRLWQRRFGGDPQVVGKTIRLSSFTMDRIIVGVMPDTAYVDLELGWGDLWRAIYYNPLDLQTTPTRSRYVRVVGRLKPGVTVAQAQAEISTIQQQLAREHPGVYAGWQVEVESVRDAMVGRARPALLVAAGAVWLVLFTACMTVANLLLARAAGHQREWAVRTAMGATRWQLFKELLTDGMVLATFGMAAGLPLAAAAIAVLGWLHPDLPRAGAVTLNLPVLAMTLSVTALSALVFSVVPLVAVARQDIQQTLKQGGRSSTSGHGQHLVRRGLVVSQVACAVVLLVGAGLLLRSLARLLDVDPGFDMDRTLVFDLDLPYSDAAERRSFLQRFHDALATRPEVEAVGLARYFPYHARLWATQVRPEGQTLADGREPVVHLNFIHGEFLKAMGIPLLHGEERAVRPQSQRTPGEPIPVLVNERFAEILWGTDEAVGQTFREGEGGPYVVTGVVGNVRQRSLAEPPGPELYLVEDLTAFLLGTFVLRTRVPPDQLIAPVREILRALDPNLPVNDLMPLRQFAERTIAPQRLALTLLGAFAVIALLLAAIGLYGVVAGLVAQRTPEIGTRLAIGAPPSHVLGLVIGEGLRLVLGGLVAGVAVSLAGGRMLRSLLYDIAATDLATLAATCAVILAVTVFACLLPATRATRIEPLVALRQE